MDQKTWLAGTMHPLDHVQHRSTGFGSNGIDVAKSCSGPQHWFIWPRQAGRKWTVPALAQTGKVSDQAGSVFWNTDEKGFAFPDHATSLSADAESPS